MKTEQRAKLKASLEAAADFIRVGIEARKRDDEERELANMGVYCIKGDGVVEYKVPVRTKEFAAARRASMELTRSLAELRKPCKERN
jgi:hypothetical protein